ncbi:MAG TPA: bacteriohopanetetrol glucosamine biosynthesis glycosyltransferase HpnI, partial [Candidatus Acidoferrum sp.]|nr:bacteriohopanetetrol glucosamine biosynthesis glycosyltransferase HpnI [Candidatus Acidoferrum sp.]
LVLVLAIVPLAYYLVAIVACIRFFRRERSRSLPDFRPPVSLLKPVYGVDFATYENYASFCRQNYAEYEILFCVNDLSDPAVPVIRRLISGFPQIPIRLLSGAEQIGTNRKVNNLALLSREARHEILIQTDGDVRVGPDFLRELVAPFVQPDVGVVSCFYKGIVEPNLGAELEAIGATTDFFPGAMVADWKEGVTFALGAAVATTKTWLGKIGGYEALANYLADDYEIGNRTHQAGAQVLLAREPVWTVYPARSLRGFWEHQLRWARTTRIVRPASYLGLLVTHGLAWAVAAAICAPAALIGLAYLVAYLVLRLALAWTAEVWGLQDDLAKRKPWLVPLRDAVHFVVWVAGFASNRIHWSGRHYQVREGKMIPLA